MHTFNRIAIWLAAFSSVLATPSHRVVRQATNGPDQGTIIWICSSNTNPAHYIPEVCKDMCYGAYCRGFGTLLTWDDYAGGSKDQRAKAAGCGKRDHCTTDPPGTGSYQCDAYPFGSTRDADRTDILPVNRCVPSDQQNRQGARLYQLFNSKGPWKNSQGLDGSPPAEFQQSFSNSGEIAYCSGKHNGKDCQNDGLQYDRRGKIVDSLSNCTNTVPRELFQYRLRSGEIIEVPDEFEVGHRVWLPREHNSTLLVEQSEVHVYDRARGLEQFEHMLDNLYMEEDFVEERLS